MDSTITIQGGGISRNTAALMVGGTLKATHQSEISKPG
jgi:hypothetical protein